MILTGGILLLTLVGTVQPLQFGNLQLTNTPKFGYNQALSQNLPPFPSNQPQFFPYPSNQDQVNRLQLNNNAQRFHQNPQLLQEPRFYSGVQQQHSIQQRQVPSAPIRAIQQQQFYNAPSLQPQQTARFAPANAPNKAANPVASDTDFLSSLQIIDTQGRLRELRDFGLGGTGSHLDEPELERQLKFIFDTIHRDLENAEFLPLDMNGAAHQQINKIFEYNKESTQPNSGTRQHQNQQQSKQQIVSEERPRLPQAASQVGYSFRQPNQKQFQFLQPARGNKVLESPIRSPAQTLRDAKKLPERAQEEQRPIEQAPLKQDNQVQLPVKGSPEPQAARQPQQTQQLEDNKYQHSQKGSIPIQKIPETKTTTQQQPEVQPLVHRDPVSQYQVPAEQQQQVRLPNQAEKKPVPQTAFEQQQQGFDEEPAPLKTVERDLSSAKEPSIPRVRPVDSSKQVFPNRDSKVPIEKPVFDLTPLNQAPIQQQQIREIKQRPIQQQQQAQRDITGDEHLAERSTYNSKKNDGWVPIVHNTEPATQQQKFIEPELPLEQVKEEQGFDVQRPTGQQKEPEIKQQNYYSVSTSPTLPEIEQQQVSKGPSRLNKIRTSIDNRFASASRSKSNSNHNVGFQATDIQQQKEQIPDQEQQQQQQRDDIPVQQQEEALAVVLEEQRQDLVQQQRVQDDVGKQEFSKTEQRDESAITTTTTTTTTTPKPVQRNDQVKGGRKVRLQMVDKFRTPVQKARDQQTKVIKQQQQQIPQEKPEQFQQQQLLKAADREVKRPRQLPQASQTIRQQQILANQEEFQQVKEEIQGPTSIEEPGTPILSTFRQTPRNQDQRRQQELIKEHREDSGEKQKGQEFVQQQQEQTLVQEDQTQSKEEEQFDQKKENLGQKRVELPPQQNEDFTNQQKQQQEEVFEKKDDQQSQQKEEVSQQVVKPATEQKSEPVQQQKDELTEEKVDQMQQQQQEPAVTTQKDDERGQQKVEVMEQKGDSSQQKEEANQQTEEKPQLKEESQKPSEEPSQVRDESLVQQNEEQAQQKEEAPQQQQQQQQQQQRQRQEEPIQEQDNSAEQIVQHQDLSSKQPDTTQQQQQFQDDNTQTQQQVTQQEQKQDDGSSASQQPLQEEGKQQDDVQVQQQVKQTEESETQALSQEKQKVSDLPQGQVQEEKTQVEDEPVPITTARPPTRIIRPITLKKDTRVREKVGEAKQEAAEQANQQVTEAPRRGWRMNQSSRLSFKSNEVQRQEQQAQTRGRFSTRQRNDGTSSNNNAATHSRINNEGYLSAHQLLNTYNPLQFEPERISSLNRAIETSSQNTNVNSSGESSY